MHISSLSLISSELFQNSSKNLLCSMISINLLTSLPQMLMVSSLNPQLKQSVSSSFWVYRLVGLVKSYLLKGCLNMYFGLTMQTGPLLIFKIIIRVIPTSFVQIVQNVQTVFNIVRLYNNQVLMWSIFSQMSRKERVWVMHFDQLCISVFTGLVIILHHNYFIPLLEPANIHSAVYSLIIIAIFKAVFIAFIKYKIVQKKKDPKRCIQTGSLIQSTIVKISTHMSFILLLTTTQNLTFSITNLAILILIFSMNFFKQSVLMQVLWKGRGLSLRPIFIFLLYGLIITANILQPTNYAFTYSLYFQIFLIFTTILLTFSFFYLQKLSILLQGTPTALIFKQTLIELISLCIMAILYYVFGWQTKGFQQQLAYIWENIGFLSMLVILNIFYDWLFLKALRRISIFKLIITLTTGILWFNIYHMIHNQIQVHLYISVIVMLTVLTANLKLFSQQNWQKCKNWLNFCINQRNKKNQEVIEEQM